VCLEYGIAKDELLKRGKKDKRTDARAAFCHQSHLIEFIPLSVIAAYLRTTIPPIAAHVKRHYVKS
jgi:hypothetical protein